MVGAALLLVGCGDEAQSPAPPAASLDYAGSEACAPCHQAETRAWQSSHHAHAERELSPGLDTHALSMRGEASGCTSPGDGQGDCLWHAAGPDGAPRDTPILRVFGHDPLWQYLVADTTGRIQVTQAAYDPHAQEWFDVYADDPREPDLSRR